mgnify:FL=1
MTKGDLISYIRKEYENSDGSEASINRIAKKISINPSLIKWQIEKAAKEGDPWIATTTEVKEEVKPTEDIINSIFDKYDINAQQRLFCIYYTESFNPRIASLKAGYENKRLSSKIAMLMSSKIITDCIQEIVDALTSKIAITQEKIIERHMQIAFSDMNDFVEYGTEEVEENIRDHEGTIIDSVPVIKSFLRPKPMDEVDSTLIKKIKIGNNGFEVEIEDRSKSLDFLSKLFTTTKLEQEKMALERHKAMIDQSDDPKALADKIKQLTDKDMEVLMNELQSHQ